MENIKIEVHSHGMPCQIYDDQGNDEDNKNTISVLWCNINRWGAQENHYDLLVPIVKEEQNNKTFEQHFLEKEKERETDRKYKDNYIGRRIKNEMVRGTSITTLNVSGSL
eukprot:14732787-Heterocapsa_arctica.AAC.1